MSTISAGTTTTTGLVQSSDTTGALVLQTGSSSTTALTLSTAQNATFANTVNLPNTFGFKNRIINGGMVIDQRNAGASVTIPATAVQYTIDRWAVNASQASKFSVQQNAGSVTPPAGYINYLGVTSLSAYSLAAGDYFQLYQNIEGLNIADLGFGTTNAKTVTLSFQVYSSLTGTFGGVIANSATTRVYPFSYTISSANTWTQISVTIAGDTTGTWLTTNGIGFQVRFSLGMGSTYTGGTAGAWTTSLIYPTSTSVVSTSGATFYLTGVQLEVGSQATSFDFRDYGRELILCQRYCFFPPSGANYVGGMNGASSGLVTIVFPVVMRVAPSATIAGTWTFDNYVASGTGSVALQNSFTTAVRLLSGTLSGLGGGSSQAFEIGPANTGTIILSAEL
jgi:hypothetical protein